MAQSIRERIKTVSLDGMTEEQVKTMKALAYFAETYADNMAREYRERGQENLVAGIEELAENCSGLWDRCVDALKELSRG